MSLAIRFHLAAVVVPILVGCGPIKRVHIMPEVAGIDRVAVVNLADRGGKPRAESEFFTNEFVSLGFSVVERGHLQEVIKEAFTSTGYLDERSVAQWGRGLGIEAVVLHQMLDTVSADEEGKDFDVSGWVRMVDVETGKIILTYNIQMDIPAQGSTNRAAKLYAESVVEDMRRALESKGIVPGSGTTIRVEQRTEVRQKSTSP